MSTIKMDHRRCGRCRRPLKNPKSMAIGYGPKCLKEVCGDECSLNIMQSLPRTIVNVSAASEAFGELSRRILLAMGEDLCSCGERLDAGDVSSYDHEGGMKLRGFEKPQWAYIVCKCGHQIAYCHIANLKWNDLELTYADSPRRALATGS
jgi:hypothetical protein